MKLFIWENVLCDYACGIMFALAETVDDARKQLLAILEQTGEPVPTEDLDKEPQVVDITEPVARIVWGGS
jgi:hypothetical protein